MPREIISVQIGQCGNQLGMRWWDVMLQESKTHPPDEPTQGSRPSSSTPRARASAPAFNASRLKARCVAVDMEQGVLHSMLRGPLQGLFDSNFFVSDVSGAGNNWAVGHMEYGDQYIDSITETVRRQVEQCDCIQAFFVMHSLSGGTGSGLGTRVLGMLEEEFPHVFRISPVVLPSLVDDVVTAPYNACFALKELIEHADCVLPLDNDALARMADTALGKGKNGTQGPSSDALAEAAAKKKSGKGDFTAAMPTSTKGLPYESMNGLVAQMLSNITCGMRFPGPLNMDVNEITTNLVPYARLNMLVPSLAPLRLNQKSSTGGARSVDAMISACLSKEHRFVDLPATNNQFTSLATALIARGPQITVGDLRRNIHALHDKLMLPYWNQDGFKTAICGVSPLGHTNSILMLSNNCGIAGKIEGIYKKFMKLYSVRSHVHHYESYLTLQYFESASEVIRSTIEDYQYLDTAVTPRDVPRSMKDLLLY
eukprot:gene10038-7013_t